ncbi:PAS domain-containing protein [Proteobacteria bacterium 005FR1]|nr:PAS domain-containing protein [Proteobacteria bacterium 005FR1]
MGKSSTAAPEVSPAVLKSLLASGPYLLTLLRGPDHRIAFATNQLSSAFPNRALIDVPLARAIPELESFLPVLDRVREAALAGDGTPQPVRLPAPEEEFSDKQLQWYVRTVPDGDKVILALAAVDLNEPIARTPAATYARDLKFMSHLSGSLFAVMGHDRRFRKVSPTFTTILGWPPTEILGRDALDLIHPEDRKATETGLSRLAGGKAMPAFENRMLGPDGSSRRFLWKALSIPEEKLIYAAGRDITESKAAEEALLREAAANSFRIALADVLRPLETSQDIQRESARVIAEYFKVPRVNFAVIDSEREFAIVHEEYADNVPSAVGVHRVADYRHIFEHDDTRVVTVFDLKQSTEFSDEERQAYRHLQIDAFVIIRLIKKNRVAGVLTVADTKPHHWHHADVALMQDAAERIWSAIERTEAEAELRKSEERYRLVGQATNDILWDWNPVTNKVEWNDSLYTTLGYKPEEIQDILTWRELVHPDDKQRVVSRYFKVMDAHENIWTDEYQLRRKDGTYATLLDRGLIARDETGRPYRMVGSMMDLTERRRAEEALREANAKLVDSDRRKDEFLAMLAHELRNPLAAIHNTVQLLDRVSRDDRTRHFLEILRRQSETLGGLVDDLLDVSRVTRGLVMLRQEAVNMNAIAERALESIRILAEQKRHRTHLELAQEPVIVQGDPMRLEQILVNLLTNAAKYTDPGGFIDLEVGKQDDCAVIRVRDTGIGIAPEMREHIFDLFGQAERGLDRAQGGLGIGLTIVKRLIELHGGKIDVRSEGLGRGAEFAITLPLIAMSEAWVLPPREESTAPERKRVLVVEDSPDIAETLTALLEASGHEVAAANDGPSALEIARQFDPDLVLLDIGLPGMDGYEVARRMRENPSTHDTVLAALTGYGQESDRRSTEAAGFNAHFVKPVDFQILNNFVNSVPSVHARQRPDSPPH